MKNGGNENMCEIWKQSKDKNEVICETSSDHSKET